MKAMKGVLKWTTSGGRFSLLFCSALVLLAFILIPAFSHAQNYSQAQLDQNILQQNNLKNNINFLTQLSNQARSRAQLARMAGDRGAYNSWANQYNQLQDRIRQFQWQLNNLQGQEQSIRSAFYQGNNPVRRPSSGGKPMNPAYSAQNPNRSPNPNFGRPGVGVNPAPNSGAGSGGGGGRGYQNDPNTIRLLDMGAPGR
ncbi:MAG: hypothetical protein GX751_10530 [Desulfuromonadaceae bacterium]|nr:hypothetical protein [Desulfuromonadaceae bacterium]